MLKKTNKTVSNWGNYPKVKSEIYSFSEKMGLSDLLKKSDDQVIARGMGRCYGDSALNKNIVTTLAINKFVSFDKVKGILTCEGGVTFDEVLQVVVPCGYFLPVSPGTKFVSVGGAIASDVHGKNHHIDGSFSSHVLSIKIVLANGNCVSCSREENNDLFEATCGGMGLTGIITEATFRLKRIESAYITQKQIKARHLDELLDLFEKHKNATYSVAWVDCLATGNSFGRGILMLGEHADASMLTNKQKKKRLKVHSKPKLNIPFNFPSFILNTWSIRLFNFLFYNKNFKREIKGNVHYEGFFYPLDNIHNWNRMYGKPGFLQYQFVIPLAQKKVLREIMLLIAKNKKGSFLSVLKIFGSQKDLMSFPMEGYTLSLDFPNTPTIHKFLEELDQLVLQAGGRIYLTKDARMSAGTFKASYPNIEEFKSIITKYNHSFKFQSEQSKRLSILN